MAETKSQAFHRLAQKRVEAMEDAYRILGHLSSTSSYDWTPDEVREYFARLDAASDAALARFTDTKRWRETAGAPRWREPAPADEPVVEEPSPAPSAAPPGRTRVLAIGQIIAEAANCRETLAEMVALQREVIESLQARLTSP